MRIAWTTRFKRAWLELSEEERELRRVALGNGPR